MPTSLGLDDDLDDVYLIADLQDTFDVNLAGKDGTVYCRTVGDLFALIEARLPENASTGRCATAMTFYRLRRALQPRVTTALRPDTPISVLAGIPAKELKHIIEHECGLNPPACWHRLKIMTFCLAMLATITIALFPKIVNVLYPAMALPYWSIFVSVFSAFIFFKFLKYLNSKLSPTEFSSQISTFGDLARSVSFENTGRLANQGARLRVSDAWEVYKDILAHHTELPRDLIEPDTLILDPQFAAA